MDEYTPISDEGQLLSEFVNQFGQDVFFSLPDSFEYVSDPIKEEYSAESSHLQNSPPAIHSVQYQDSLQLPPLSLATSDMPATDEYHGPHNFEIQVDSRSSGRNWVFSSRLNKLFIDINKVTHLAFRFSSVASDVYVRALLIFTEAQYFKEPVVRCLYHKAPVDGLNKDVDGKLLDNVLLSDHSSAVYLKDDRSGRHSVRVPLDHPQAGVEWVKVPFRFMCKNSCNTGMNRRPTEMIFTLENESGGVLGRHKMKVRICSCPKRDKDKEEADGETGQTQPIPGGKRKLHPNSESQNKVAKRKLDGFCQQLFISTQEARELTVIARARLEDRLDAENREPSEKEAMLLNKYKNDLKLWK